MCTIHSATSRPVSQDDGHKISKYSYLFCCLAKFAVTNSGMVFFLRDQHSTLSHSAPSPNTTRKKRHPIHPYPHLRPCKLFVRITVRSSATAISWSVWRQERGRSSLLFRCSSFVENKLFASSSSSSSSSIAEFFSMALCLSPVCSGALEATGFGVQACEGRGTTVRATSMSIFMPRLQEGPFQKLHVSMPGPTSWSHQRLHQASCVVAEASEVTLDTEAEEVTTEKDPNPLIPNSFEIQSLIMEVCDETSIAELQLKMGDFSLRVKREIGKIAAAAPVAQPAPPVPTKPMLESIPAASIPTAPKPTALSAAIVKPVSNFGLLEAAADAGLLFVTSPKVGYFRKGRVVKGKKGPPLCEEGQIINKGQVVCYLEQLGTQQPVESDITGEVEKVLWKDGEPVGYGDPLIAIRPSFQGIKIKKFNE